MNIKFWMKLLNKISCQYGYERYTAWAGKYFHMKAGKTYFPFNRKVTKEHMNNPLLFCMN